MMKNRKPYAPTLPNNMVVIKKSGGRDIWVTILDGKGMPAFGVDVRGYAPNHYRVVENGNFGVLVGAKHACEVRILLDGKLLLEQVVEPNGMAPNHLDPTLRQRMMESPQPHWLTKDNDGEPFLFKASDLPIDELIALQLHPGVAEAPPSMDAIDREGMPLEEVRVDVDPRDFGFNVDAPEGEIDADTVREHIAGEVARLSQEASDASDELPTPVVADAAMDIDHEPAAEDVPSDKDGAQASHGITPKQQNKSWAPSHGLVAIGVRMIQSVPNGEMVPTNPDGFDYRLFQLNPWKLHSKMLAKIQGRVIVPTTAELRQLTADAGYEEELSSHDHVSCSLPCKHNH